VPGVPSADAAAGLTALSGVLMALIGRERTGRGDYLDIAMFDSLLPWCAHIAGEAIAGGESPRSDNQRSLGGAAFYQVYETADRRHVALGGREEKFVANLLSALGRGDLIPLGSAPAGEQEALIAFLREAFAAKTRNEWLAWFADKDVAFSPVLDFREALDQPHIAERGLLRDGQIAPAVRFANEAWEPRPAPELSA
jgi:CoA:oxalate CoA-transferase